MTKQLNWTAYVAVKINEIDQYVLLRNQENLFLYVQLTLLKVYKVMINPIWQFKLQCYIKKAYNIKFLESNQ